MWIAWDMCMEGSTRVQDISRHKCTCILCTAYVYSRFDPFHVIYVMLSHLRESPLKTLRLHQYHERNGRFFLTGAFASNEPRIVGIFIEVNIMKRYT